MSETKSKFKKWYLSHKPLAVFLTSLAGILVLSIIFFIVFFVHYKMTTLPSNAYFHDIYLGNMKQEQVKEEIESKINPFFKENSVNIKTADRNKEFPLEPFNFHFNPQDVFDACMKCNFSNGDSPYAPISYDKNALVDEVDSLSSYFFTDPTSYTYDIKKDKLYVKAGSLGYKVQPQFLMNSILSAVQIMQFGDLDVEYENFTNESVPINIEEIHNKIFKSVANATYSIDSNGNINYQNESDGIDFDLNLAKQTINDPNFGEYIVPLNITSASITVKKLKSDHDTSSCPTLISTYSTNFSSDESSKNRNFNIAKATSSINGVVLYPGESFSALKSIGPANASQGYKEAGVYTPSGPSTGTGGGICQVSTTAYLAAIYGYMDIVERHCHSYTVGYVPLGYDAAFSSPSTDLRFKNTRNAPVKIVASTTSSSITVSIFGTPSDLDKCKVSLNSTVQQTIPPGTKEQPTKDLSAGQTKVDVQGQNGYVVNTRKTVTKNGAVIEEKNIQSSYKPITKVVLVGTGVSSSKSLPYNDTINISHQNVPYLLESCRYPFNRCFS